MKKIKWLSFAVMGALACTMASCSDDEPGGAKNEQEQGNGFYASVTLQLPTAMGSRSETKDPENPGTGETPGEKPSWSSGGYETGKDYENAVSSMVVVLATKTAGTNGAADQYNYVTSADGAIVQSSTGNGTQPTFVMQFDSESLKPYAKEGAKEDTPLWIFAFCNPTPKLRATLDDLQAGNNISDLTASITDPNAPEIAIKNAFMMTNAELYDHTINETWVKLMANHGTRSSAYNLTPDATGAPATGVDQTGGNTTSDPLKVERTSCRFDFKQTTISGQTAANTYPIKDVTGTSSTVFAKVQIQQMALFNERTEFYAIRHAATGPNPTAPTAVYGTPALCGTETPNNYVISPDWSTYVALTEATLGNVTDNYFLPLNTVTTAGTTQWQTISALNEDDNHTSTNPNPGWDDPTKTENADYKIWRYATENTLPVANQRHEITTGVVFKAQILPADDATADLAKSISDAMTNGKTIYAYNEEDGDYENTANHTMIFGSALDMYNYCRTNVSSVQRVNFIQAVIAGVFSVKIGNGTAISGSTATEAAIFPADIAEGTTVTVSELTGATDNTVLEKYNLMCYTPSTDGKYYCYYYYYNRHNNNGDDSVMGPMEFATVRNNIYKLKVDDVLTLGLPSDTPPDPWIPDENPKVFFKVSVKVLDWVVRKNNISF